MMKMKSLAPVLAVGLTVTAASPAAAQAQRDLNTEPAEFVASGNDIQDRLGRSIAFGDIDDDGLADLASGAPLDEPPGVDTKDNRGALHVYFGKSGFSGQFSDPDLIIYGEEGGGRSLGDNNNSDVFGKGVTMGDVDGDGKADLVVSSLRAKPVAGQPGGRFGKVYVFYQKAAWPSVIDLAQDPGAADVTIIGDRALGDFGIHLDSADFDKDGFEDILVGAAAVTKATLRGALRVVYGSASLPKTIDLRAPPPGVATLFVQGTDASDKLGHGVAAGDLNGDGVADMAGGAPFGGAGCRATQGGKAHVIFGSTTRITGTRDLATTPADVTVTSGDAGDEMGRRLAIGDVGGSGTDDLILGAPCGDGGGRTDNGVGYVLFGPLGGGTKNIGSAAQVTVFGEDAEDGLGVGPGAGDIDGDGKDDLILGADGGDGPQENRDQAGEAAVLFGPVTKGIRDLATSAADITIYGPDKDDHLGVFADAGDVNGDGREDLAVTAPFANGLDNATGPHTGEVHVLTTLEGTGGGDGCTIIGTPGDEELEGTPGDDVICGLGGNDVLLGLGGNDLLLGGGGKDLLDGGKGKDTLEGGAGADTLDGRGASDLLLGQGGPDLLIGRGGPDVLKGGKGNDTVRGGPGKDSVIGNAGNDVLRGNKGNDALKGSRGDDVLNGGPGIDTCRPGPGKDVLRNCEG